MLATCPASRSLLGFNILSELDDYINHVFPSYVISETVRFLSLSVCVCVCVCVCVLAVDIFPNLMFSNVLFPQNKMSRMKILQKKMAQ